jgi:hypothetical protein
VIVASCMQRVITPGLRHSDEGEFAAGRRPYPYGGMRVGGPPYQHQSEPCTSGGPDEPSCRRAPEAPHDRARHG